MNEKIQKKLAVMTVWAQTSERIEELTKAEEENILALSDHIKEENEKPEEERRDWWIKSYERDKEEAYTRLNALKEVQAHIYKIMG